MSPSSFPNDGDSNQPRAIQIAIAVVVGLSVLGGVFDRLERNTTDLGPDQEGTQQEWVDYFDAADPAVDTLNTFFEGPGSGASPQEFLDALETIGKSPDPSLNRQVESAQSYCEAGNMDGCVTAINSVTDSYNRVLQRAETDGLLEIVD